MLRDKKWFRLLVAFIAVIGVALGIVLLIALLVGISIILEHGFDGFGAIMERKVPWLMPVLGLLVVTSGLVGGTWLMYEHIWGTKDG